MGEDTWTWLGAANIKSGAGAGDCLGPPTLEILRVSDIRFTQEKCGGKFQDGRTLMQLVSELCAGQHNLMEARFLQLEVISKRERHGRVYLSNDNRRLWCLKEYERLTGHAAEIRARVSSTEVLPAPLRRFVDRYNPTYR